MRKESKQTLLGIIGLTTFFVLVQTGGLFWLIEVVLTSKAFFTLAVTFVFFLIWIIFGLGWATEGDSNLKRMIGIGVWLAIVIIGLLNIEYGWL
jgi:hypothetical protein